MVLRLTTYEQIYPLCLTHMHIILVAAYRISIFLNLSLKCLLPLPFRAWSTGIAFLLVTRASILFLLSNVSWKSSFYHLTDDLFWLTCLTFLAHLDLGLIRIALIPLTIFISNFIIVLVNLISRTLLETSPRTFTGYPWFGLLQLWLYIVLINQNTFFHSFIHSSWPPRL